MFYALLCYGYILISAEVQAYIIAIFYTEIKTEFKRALDPSICEWHYINGVILTWIRLCTVKVHVLP